MHFLRFKKIYLNRVTPNCAQSTARHTNYRVIRANSSAILKNDNIDEYRCVNIALLEYNTD